MHTSFQNVLSRTFRQASATSPGPLTIAAWLAPAVAASARPPRRHFSKTKQRRAQPPNIHHDNPSAAPQSHRSRPTRLRTPGADKADSAKAWVDRLEHFLPPHLSATPASAPAPPNIGEKKIEHAKDISWYLARTRSHPSADILSFLALEQGRWDAVMWIVKTIVEMPIPEKGRLEDIVTTDTVQWIGYSNSMAEVTNEPITAQRAGEGLPFQRTLDQLSHFQDHGDEGVYYRNGALGVIWRSLGNMILSAVGEHVQDKEMIMAHVLELLAFLHHTGIIPESIYHYEAPKDAFSIQQPPTLYLLSSRILTALSDAAWRAQEMAAVASNKRQAQYNFLGQEIPGSRYKVRTPELGSEVWLELVLWSCLHGGWAIDGAEVLKRLASYKGRFSRWSIIHWRNILQDQAGSSFRNMTWSDLWSFARARGTQANSPDRFIVERTISSEVVAAYIDRLLIRISMGVGSRGDPVLQAYKDVIILKDFLHRDNLGLGTASWESVMVRFLESGGIDPNTEGRWLEKIAYFSSRYGQEHEFSNAPHERKDCPGSPSYVLDPSAISLGVLHQALRIHVKNGNIEAAARVITRLQAVTDENKTLSIQNFFQKLKSSSENTPDMTGSFSSNIPAHTYPTYFPHIPPTLLAGILKLATQTKAYDFARHLLYTDDFEGPLIPQDLYSHDAIAAAVIDYAVAANDQHLLHDVISIRTRAGTMTLEMTQTLLDNQMRSDKWDVVEKVVRTLAMSSEEGWVANTSAMLVKRLLILQARVSERGEAVDENHPLTMAASILRRLLRARFGEGNRERYDRFHGILCVLISVGPEWQDFCSRLLVHRGPRLLENSVREEDFAQILQGVAESRGAHAGLQLVGKWCKGVEHAQPLEARPRVEEKRPPPALAKGVDEISVPLPSEAAADDAGARLVLRGRRLTPSLPLMRIVYQTALDELDRDPINAWGERKVKRILKWALKGLTAMGLREKEVAFELRGIANWEDLDRKEAAMRVIARRPKNRTGRMAGTVNEKARASVHEGVKEDGMLGSGQKE